MEESFRPVALDSSTGIVGRLKFYGRLALDLQVATVYSAIRNYAENFSGKILDVGCGASPYKFLFDPKKSIYVGLDIADAEKFDYRDSSIVSFNGKDIPFPENTYDGVLCTEVLEHVQDYQVLVDEIHRVMKTGSIAVITVPWSARFHYIPYDYFRYTPSALQAIFKDFKEVQVINRGTDVTSIVAKILVIWFRNLVPAKGSLNLVKFFASVLFIPAAILLAGVGHLSAWGKIGSADDPLGYTVLLVK